MMNGSGENGDRSDGEDSFEDYAPNNDSVESYKYSADKLMMCEVCKVLVRKDMYSVCHDYRGTHLGTTPRVEPRLMTR